MPRFSGEIHKMGAFFLETSALRLPFCLSNYSVKLKAETPPIHDHSPNGSAELQG